MLMWFKRTLIRYEMQCKGRIGINEDVGTESLFSSTAYGEEPAGAHDDDSNLKSTHNSLLTKVE
jgi:hypothetical protein